MRRYEFLKTHWWHRLFVVFNVILSICIFAVSGISAYSVIEDSEINTVKITSLEQYSKDNQGQINTVPTFLQSYQDSVYKIGCFKDGSVMRVYPFQLNDTYCNANLKDKVWEISGEIKNKSYPDADRNDLYIKLQSIVDKDVRSRTCFMPKNVGCSSDELFSYRQNEAVRAGESIAVAALSTGTWVALSALIYFKGLIYIIFGKKN